MDVAPRSSSPCAAPQLPFRVAALLDLYSGRSGTRECAGRKKALQALSESPSRSISDAEKKIGRHFCGDQGISRLIETFAHYQWTVSFSNNNPRFTIQEKNTDCAFVREFGADRFLGGVIDRYDSAVKEVLSEGISFGSCKFIFIGGKLLKSCDKKHSDLRETNTAGGFYAWFFAVDASNHFNALRSAAWCKSDHSVAGDFGRRVGAAQAVIPVSAVFDFLGHFDVGNQASIIKRNARLELGFSTSLPAYIVKGASRVSVREDYESGGGIMSDGCGFIASDLVQSMPHSVCDGEAIAGGKCTHSHARDYCNCSRPRLSPSLIQVRAVGSKGLFKGCLINTPREHSDLCASRSVVFTKSMQKATGCEGGYGGSPVAVSAASENVFACELELGLKDTFDRPSRGRLNRDAILLLRHGGVPENVFIGITEEEINRVLFASVDRHMAEDLVAQSMWRAAEAGQTRGPSPNTNPNPKDKAEEEAEEDDDTDTDNDLLAEMFSSVSITDSSDGSENSTTKTDGEHGEKRDSDPYYYRKHRPVKTVAENASEMLMAGHAISDPYLQAQLRILQVEALSQLKKFKLRLDDCTYLPGCFDPLGLLGPDEVYVECFRETPQRRRQILNQTHVLVTRNPMMHPGDIRKLRAVYHEDLARFFAHTVGNIICFSRQGSVSAAALMSSGDFDGDKYLVIHNDSIVIPFTESEPFIPKTITEKSTSNESTGQEVPLTSTVNVDSGLIVWDALGKQAKDNILGLYSNAWLRAADRWSPSDPRALEIQEQVLVAHDAAKTGKPIKRLRSLHTDLHPHYMGGQRRSESILGVLYDQIIAAEASLGSDCVFNLDPAFDMSFRGDTAIEQKANEFLKMWSRYHVAYNAAVREIKNRCPRGCRQKTLLKSLTLEYRDKFDLGCMNLFNLTVRRYNMRKRYATDGHPLVVSTPSRSSSSALQPVSSSERDTERGKLYALRDLREYDTRSSADDSVASNRFDMHELRGIEDTSRELLACIVYTAVYSNAKSRQSTDCSFGPAVSLCWELCAAELHRIKRKMKERESDRKNC